MRSLIRNNYCYERGKSEHHRAGYLLTGGRGDPTESATENRPPIALVYCSGRIHPTL